MQRYLDTIALCVRTGDSLRHRGIALTGCWLRQPYYEDFAGRLLLADAVAANLSMSCATCSGECVFLATRV